MNVLAGSLTLLDRKRLELARALATDPTVLLLDEIAGGLTEAEVEELLEEIRKLRKTGITIVWIEHIVHALLAVVDRITVIQFGRKLCEGEPHAGHEQRRGPGLLHGRDAGMSLLEIENVSVYYEDFQALYDLNIKVEEGEIFACIGANGAGKSHHAQDRGRCSYVPRRGRILFDGQPIDHMPTYRRVEIGISSVPEGRRVFPSLTVHENLLIGAYRNRKGPWTTDTIYELFPLLAAP